MKVGVFTYHNAYSYGAHLQAYALQEIIRSLGHDAWIIDYKGDGFVAPRIRDLLCLSRTPWRLPDAINQYYTKKGLLEFAKLQHRTVHYPSYQSLMQAPPVFDAYVCGSDQIWQPKKVLDGRPIQDEYFLSFVKNGGKKIAYAPSFGRVPSASFICSMAPYLREFNHVSVREDEMREIVGKVMGQEVPSVCDPTILLGREGFEKILPKSKASVGVFYFPLSLNLPRDREICKLLELKYKHLEIVSRNRSLWFVGENVTPSPIEWVRKIRDSEFVLTNSFHGTVFAILFHKPFITLCWANETQNVRVANLLRKLGLVDRFWREESSSHFLDASSMPINWDSVDEKMQVWRSESLKYLKEALEK